MVRFVCLYCDSPVAKVTHNGVYHKVERSFGPFDLFTCAMCGSLATANPPTLERLAHFYAEYDKLRPEWYQNASMSGALSSQYQYYARFLHSIMPSRKGIKWADIGSGHGEVGKLLQAKRNDAIGTAIDLSLVSPFLDADINYISLDLNKQGWSRNIRTRYDFVFSVAVLEHVLSPFDFIHECAKLLDHGGTLVAICPDYGSLARRLLGTRWPYFQPGEHQTIPTKSGAIRLFKKVIATTGLESEVYSVEARSLWVGYSVRYYFEVARLHRFAEHIPSFLPLPLPTGILAIILKLKS